MFFFIIKISSLAEDNDFLTTFDTKLPIKPQRDYGSFLTAVYDFDLNVDLNLVGMNNNQNKEKEGYIVRELIKISYI
jgi:hypothetical protein